MGTHQLREQGGRAEKGGGIGDRGSARGRLYGSQALDAEAEPKRCARRFMSSRALRSVQLEREKRETEKERQRERERDRERERKREKEKREKRDQQHCVDDSE